MVEASFPGVTTPRQSLGIGTERGRESHLPGMSGWAAGQTRHLHLPRAWALGKARRPAYARTPPDCGERCRLRFLAALF